MNEKNREFLIKSAMKRFPMHLIKTTRNLFSMAKMGKKAVLPFKIQFESTAVCNLKCRMCPQNIMKREKGHLKFEVFKKIYDQIMPPYLNLTGFGEPLLNPDIFKIITYAKEKGSFVKLDTNGTLLTEENINKLLDTKIDVISNSIDAVDKKTYEKIRIGANFDKVIANLKKLIEIRNKRGGKTEVHIYFVLMKDNFKQFLNFIKFGDSLGVNSISGKFIGEETYEKNADYDITHIKKEELDKFAEELRKLKKSIKANVEIDEIIEYVYTWKEKKNKNWGPVPCYKPWYSPFILWDGSVSPCCYCGTDKAIVFGDASKEKFEKIWNGKSAREFRKMVTNNRIGYCTKCEGDESYIAKQFNKNPILSLIVKKKL